MSGSISSLSIDSSCPSSEYLSCSRSREMASNEVSVKNLPPRKSPPNEDYYRTPVWLIGRNY